MKHLSRKVTAWSAATGRQIGFQNSTLVDAVGVCPILVAGVSLQNGVALTVCLLVALLPATLLLQFCGGKLPKWLMPSLYLLLTAGALAGTSALIQTFFSTEVYASLYLFFPILAVNTVRLCRTAMQKNDYTPARLWVDMLDTVLGFGVIICLISALREWMAYGTVWGVSIGGSPLIEAAILPFAALFLLGLMAAFLKAVRARFFSDSAKGVKRRG